LLQLRDKRVFLFWGQGRFFALFCIIMKRIRKKGIPMIKEADVWQAAQPLMPPLAQNDDCFHEVISPKLKRLYSLDTFVEGTHFDLKWQSLQSIAWRCLAASLSDLAACGGTPLSYLIGLTLPENVTQEEVDAFYEGLHVATQAMAPELALWGGDTTRGSQWVISLSVIGQVAADVTLTRSQAQVGHVILTTGHSGLAGLGCQLLSLGKDIASFPEAIQHFKRPTAQLQAGQCLAKLIPQASLMDTSDGLADALVKCAKASGTHFTVDGSKIVVSSELLMAEIYFEEVDTLDLLFYGGEDFHLLASVPQAAWLTHKSALEAVGFYDIGVVEACVNQAPYASVQWQDGFRQGLFEEKSFQHFQATETPT
jgi:thiamine-monophosphate kinase